MHNPEKIILTNMCMIYHNDQVLVQNRIKSWKGIAFPGGHVEPFESIIDSTIREINEETGLNISNLEICGIKQWFLDDIRNICFLYKTNHFEGNLISNNEGNNFWINIKDIYKYELANGFSQMLEIFLKEESQEYYHLNKDNHLIDIIK